MDDGVNSEDSNTMNDKMTNWISEHPNLISYLILEDALPYEDQVIPSQFLLKRSEKHKKIIATLKEQYNNHISLLVPKQFAPSKRKTNLPPILNSKYSFIQYKLENLKRKQFEQYSKNVAELLMFFGDDIFLTKTNFESNNNYKYIPENVIFNFNFKSFEQDSFKESNKMISLKYLSKSLEELNRKITNNIIQLSKNKNDQRKLIFPLLQGIMKINDEVLSYFPLSPLDHEFEKIFFSPIFPFKSDFFDIVEHFAVISPTETITNILELSYKIIRFYNLPESPTDSILFLLIFRILYNELYSRNALPFFQIKNTLCNQNKIIITNTNDPKINTNKIDNDNNYTSNNSTNGNSNSNTNSDNSKINNIKFSLFDFINTLTFATLDPPKDSSLYNDPLFNSNNNVFNIISSDQRFSPAITSLYTVIFATNPLDALNSIRLCLLGVEKTASHCFEQKEIACLIPFDKVFTIFLLVITGSGLRELFECYAPFVQSCIPERLLSLPFQFALTKLSAAETHLRRLMYEKSQDKEQKPNNMNKDSDQ